MLEIETIAKSPGLLAYSLVGPTVRAMMKNDWVRVVSLDTGAGQVYNQPNLR